MDLTRLINPKSVAVVGATDREGSYAHTTILNLIRNKYPGTVIGVNRNRSEVMGFPCVPELSDLPFPFDAVVIATPAPSVPGYLETARSLGIGGAVVFAAGFAEIGCEDLQRDLVTAAGRLPVIGPNGNGLVSVSARAALWGDHATLPQQTGSIAIISQSGNIGVTLLAHRQGLDLHSVFSVGNAAVVGTAHLLAELAQTHGVRSVGVYMEGEGDGSMLVRSLALCARNDVRVVILKAGRSPLGAAAGSAHTAAIAGDQRVFESLISEAGAVLARDPADLIETARTLARGRRDARGAAILTCSGGDAVLAADIAHDCRTELTDLSAATLHELTALLPSTATAGNPLDHTNLVWADTEAVAAITEVVGRDEGVGHLVYVQDLPPALPPLARAEWDATRMGALAGGARAHLSTMVVSSMPGQEPGDAVGGLVAIMTGIAALQRPGPDADRLVAIADASYSCISSENFADQNRVYNENDAKSLLNQIGVHVPRSGVADSAKQATMIADRIGYPVAVKVVAPGLLHKSDLGALALDLADSPAVLAASKRLLGLQHLPQGARLLVEAMAAPGVEMIVAAHRRGIVPHIMLGFGGIWAESLDDVAIIPLPVGAARVVSAISSLRGAALLTGTRGQSPLAIGALANLVEQVGALLLSANLSLIELNPVIVSRETAIAVDAIICG